MGWLSCSLGRGAGAAGDPVEHQEGAHKEGKDAIQRIADRVRAAIDGHENLGAENKGHQRDDDAASGGGNMEPADAFEPGHGTGGSGSGIGSPIMAAGSTPNK